MAGVAQASDATPPVSDMTNPADPCAPSVPLPTALLSAWLAQSRDLLAITDAAGRITWANVSFQTATGVGTGHEMLGLAPDDWHSGAPRQALLAALRDGAPGDMEIALRTLAGATLWVLARLVRVDEAWLWTLRDTTAEREIAARAQRLSELLDMAQEFGRLGVWEREIPSGKGQWDRHVFAFWGLDPAAGTPDHDTAVASIHPDDQKPQYAASTQQAGRYGHRFRVIRPDGGVRWIHSQWEVKNSPEGRPDRTIGIMVDDTETYALARSLDNTAVQLKLATELANIVIWRHDLTANRLHYNEHGLKVLGIPYRPGGTSLAEARSHTHPDDVAKLEWSARQALQTREPVDVETRHRRSDGNWRYMLVRRVVERDAAGVAIAFVGVSLDVTEQVAHSRRAEELAQRLEAAAKAARIGIWTTTLGLLQTEWNAQMYELFDMVGAPGPPTLTEWIAQCVHPDDAARVRQATQAYLRREPEPFELEFRTRLRDGRTRWMVLRADIDRSRTDATRIFGIALDVTDRHAALSALHAASERAALIASHTGIGTWETDGADSPGLWDEQMFRLRGLEPRPLAPTREERLALVHPDERSQNLDAQARFDVEMAPTSYEFRVRLPDGSYRWLASRSAALFDEHGKVVKRVGVNWDVTDRMNAQAARQESLIAQRESAAKSEFLARMSHELRTPLNAVLGFAQLLQLDDDRGAPVQRSHIDHVRIAGDHLLSLINDVLDLSSLQSGQLKLDLQPVAVADVVAEALPMVEPLARLHGITVRTGSISGSVRADRTRLRQILINLLSNAIKYNHPQGEVRVDTHLSDATLTLRVSDTGRGLTAQQVDQLFEPFNRLGLEREGIEGTGIGLAIVKALVDRMQGSIHVSSQAAVGTSVEVTLPTGASNASATLATGGVGAVARRGQILYIEDNPVNVLLVEQLVASRGDLHIVSVGTGTEGVSRARSLQPDLVLVDMQLPDFDGFEVLRRLQAQPETAALTCIALSANAIPEDIALALQAGFSDYWTKPINLRVFLSSLEALFPVPSPQESS